MVFLKNKRLAQSRQDAKNFLYVFLYGFAQDRNKTSQLRPTALIIRANITAGLHQIFISDCSGFFCTLFQNLSNSIAIF